MFNEIDIAKEEEFNPFQKIGKQWFLVSAGSEEKFNTMTASWGFMGVIWNKNTAVTVLRPQRCTKTFVDNEEYFSISFLPEEYRENLRWCGSNSGNDIPDKIAQSGLTPAFIDDVPTFEEAETVLICRKLFVQQIKPENFVDAGVCAASYPNADYHYAYVGEIVKAYKSYDYSF